MAELVGEAREAAIASWARLEGAVCPECGAPRDKSVTFDETCIEDDFTLRDGGWFTEWFRCSDCGSTFGVTRRFAPAGDAEVIIP